MRERERYDVRIGECESAYLREKKKQENSNISETNGKRTIEDKHSNDERHLFD